MKLELAIAVLNLVWMIALVAGFFVCAWQVPEANKAGFWGIVILVGISVELIIGEIRRK